jgi:hypothetical protein
MVPNQAATRIQGRFSFMDVLLKQYQKVMTNEDITHCLHGTPYEPNCGGFYP